MPCALQAHEPGDIFEVLRKYVVAATRDYGNVAHSKGEQLLAPANVVQDVNGDEIDALLRKKLFRSKAAASPGLGVEDEFFGDGGHVDVRGLGVRRLLC